VRTFPASRLNRRNRGGNGFATSQGVGRPGSLDVSFLHQLMEKPWVKGEGSVVALHDGRAFPLPTVKLGLRVFLAVVTVLFSLLVVAYADRMSAADWRSLPVPWLLWLNTVMLILSSVALQWAWGGARWGQIDVVWVGLLVGGVFAFAFLVGQLLAWQQLAAVGYFAATNPAVAFFYLITALHGLHLLGGLVAWGRTTVKVWRGFEVGQVRLSVELCAVYWHFLLLIWLVLFGLLLFT
jgi:cytochrome c oxidase subunit III